MRKTVTAGIDMGAKTVKVLILDGEKTLARSILPVGFETVKAAEIAYTMALKEAGLRLEDAEAVTVTGIGRVGVYGRPPINASDQVSEVTADAVGIVHLLSNSRTVIDVGAEEGRAIRCDGEGTVKDFTVNERCAAGAGTFIEAMARALEVGVEEMGSLALKSQRAVPMNAQCAVFAESEVVSLIHAKTPKEDISRAIHDAIANRIASMVRRVGIEREVALAGGVAKNVGFVEALGRELAVEVHVPQEPEFVGALGAALLAARRKGEA